MLMIPATMMTTILVMLVRSLTSRLPSFVSPLCCCISYWMDYLQHYVDIDVDDVVDCHISSSSSYAVWKYCEYKAAAAMEEIACTDCDE